MVKDIYEKKISWNFFKKLYSQNKKNKNLQLRDLCFKNRFNKNKIYVILKYFYKN